jgi:hypothetical protein
MGKDDSYRPRPTEVLDGVGDDSASSTEVLHSKRAVPLGEDEPPAEPPPPPAKKRHVELTERLPPSPKTRSRPKTSTAPKVGSGSRAAPLDEGEISDLRPLTAHQRLYDAVNDPLRPGTLEHSLAAESQLDGILQTDPEQRAHPALGGRSPQSQSQPQRARAQPPRPQPAPARPPAPTRSTTPPEADQRRPYPPAPGPVSPPPPARPPPQAYYPEPTEPPDPSLPPVRVVNKRRRAREVRTSRARTGIVLILVLGGMLALVGNAALKMLMPGDDETLSFSAGSRANPYTEDVGPESATDDDAPDEDERPPSPYSEDVGPVDEEPEPEEEPAQAPEPEPAEKRKPRAAKAKPQKRIALLGVRDESGRAGGAADAARAELLATLKKAGVKTVARSQATRGAQVFVEKVKRKRKPDALVVEVRCKATVRALPGDELEMSAVATASAAMSGGADDDDERELVETALSACAQKLGADVAAYARR